MTASMSGTSMAAAEVTGAAARLFPAVPTATVAQVKATLLGGVDAASSLAG